MNDLIVGAGLVLVIEGLIWAISPGMASSLLSIAAETSERSLRTAGTLAIAAGCLLVWLVRG